MKLNVVSLIAGLTIIAISFGAALSIAITKIKNNIIIKKLNVKETAINVQADSGEVIQATHIEPKDPIISNEQDRPVA